MRSAQIYWYAQVQYVIPNTLLEPPPWQLFYQFRFRSLVVAWLIFCLMVRFKRELMRIAIDKQCTLYSKAFLQAVHHFNNVQDVNKFLSHSIRLYKLCVCFVCVNQSIKSGINPGSRLGVLRYRQKHQSPTGRRHHHAPTAVPRISPCHA